MADELTRLVKLARDQGWQVEQANGRLRCRAPDGVGLAFTPDRGCHGHQLANLTTQLRRAGLRMEERPARTRRSKEGAR